MISSRKPQWEHDGITVMLEDLSMQLFSELMWVNKVNLYIPLWNHTHKGIWILPNKTAVELTMTYSMYNQLELPRYSLIQQTFQGLRRPALLPSLASRFICPFAPFLLLSRAEVPVLCCYITYFYWSRILPKLSDYLNKTHLTQQASVLTRCCTDLLPMVLFKLLWPIKCPSFLTVAATPLCYKAHWEGRQCLWRRVVIRWLCQALSTCGSIIIWTNKEAPPVCGKPIAADSSLLQLCTLNQQHRAFACPSSWLLFLTHCYERTQTRNKMLPQPCITLVSSMQYSGKLFPGSCSHHLCDVPSFPAALQLQ